MQIILLVCAIMSGRGKLLLAVGFASTILDWVVPPALGDGFQILIDVVKLYRDCTCNVYARRIPLVTHAMACRSIIVRYLLPLLVRGVLNLRC